MAIFTHIRFFHLVSVTLLLSTLTEGRTVRYTFRVSYFSGSPDGVTVDHILGINGQFPGPVIEATVGDTLEITVVNNIQDGQNATLHWHGILQKGTPFEDGPADITQCPIKAGSRQLYRFPVPQAGTYWYHSHVNSQYTEGLWGVLIVHGKPEVHYNRNDDELTITLSDWYHNSGAQNEEFLLSARSGGAPPYPSSVLMNGVGRYPCQTALLDSRPCSRNLQKRPLFRLQQGKTYRLRLLNTAGWTAFNFTVEGHALRTIEVDGVDTTVGPPVQAVHIAPGQRYSFLITIPRYSVVGSRFLIRASARLEFLFTLPNNINPYPSAIFPEVTGVIQYSRQQQPNTLENFDDSRSYTVSQASNFARLNFVDDFTITPYDRQPTPRTFDKSLTLNIIFGADAQGIRRGSFSGRPAELPPGMPLLASLLDKKPIPETMFPVYLKYGEVIEVILNNPGEGPHPIHLHGHHFWVMGMGHEGDGNYTVGKHPLSYSGIRRDTALIKERSWLVIRFRADNVGIWTMHCHVDWHMLTGMLMTFVEAPELANTLSITSEARRVCADHNIII